MNYSIAIAGTTKRTRQCAQSLLESDLFNISWVLTPIAKPIGRKQVITPNPLDNFASENGIITVWVDSKINQETQIEINKLERPDFLLVVDFGYIVPNWLLEVPRISPLNIHPSELPKWRGSSPGQFSILFNDKKSAVSLMVMDKKLDHGPIIHQDLFDINPTWNQEEYYQHAFDLICNNLDKKIANFAANQYLVIKQPEESPTLTAKNISKNETFVPWEYIQASMKGLHPSDLSDLSKLLQNAYKSNKNLALTLERASKAFNPWPNLWTIIQTNQGQKRMKIIDSELNENKLILNTVQIEGKNLSKWNEVKNSILS